jgi:predicted histone-like DNA-binding protein
MIEYDLKKNNNKKNEKAYGKYYAKPHISETVDLDELADHMHGHNSPFSAGTIKGILIDAVTHIKELLLMGKNVKLDNLAIFYISIKNKMGAENADDFTVSKNIEGVRMKARATGDFRSVNLNLDANLKKMARLSSFTFLPMSRSSLMWVTASMRMPLMVPAENGEL